MVRRRVLIMGAAGRDFHNFNCVYRDNQNYEVVCFTATQIPDIDGRKYPAVLAGKLYPEGIPIFDESELTALIKKYSVQEVVFSYSDVPHEYVMNKCSLVNACGADFTMLGSKSTQIKSTKPVISICATRTGCGKSQTTRAVEKFLKGMGKKVAAIRHPMPYGDLAKQAVQRFATMEDMDKHECTIEEREEYEPHIAAGFVIFAGVDYEKILREAEKEADIILWDGGNNDMPFYKSDLEITVVDPHRAGHELTFYPGETNLISSEVLIVNKVDTAKKADIETVLKNIQNRNPKAIVIQADSPIFVENGQNIKGKRVLVVEDGPTLTHGHMKYGAGTVAANQYGAKELVDPRPYVDGKIAETFKKYPNVGILLPAMGYGEEQMRDLEKAINKTDCDLVIIGTPIDLGKIINIKKPSVRVTYELGDKATLQLGEILKKKFK
ncbi:MAG: GTPase [Bdellovibrionales bacterium RIFOXYB1_FULL_37_110]|nr:MAG: GTPase [Bdellovibrionales bacterium RIFOXYC1_FULL_37_79]OFZ61138.1 MAG: GTPase [Bdellovibrionales bacterium RIFOXYB1_FULL_37_110]OFZ65590.1 MAG: GTPase [Bdellovibrionales bacterium RIFOXYD1_FULL_36_51]